ncbi:hypothetical protein GCM10023205_12720 [Yinghuangia aomiensis]|uniref:Uncharacterized protein n=1 Tax=Yinghuangia aomiensis TaxID=676205 RepID=A0ABP9GTB3_9ACTN
MAEAPQRGIPDGALIGALVLLIAGTAATWLATGLAGLATRQAWPDQVRFTRSGRAIRELLRDPGDIPAAWPASPADQLPSATAFWWVFGVVIAIALAFAGAVLWAWVRLTTRRIRRAAPADGRRADGPAGGGPAGGRADDAASGIALAKDPVPEQRAPADPPPGRPEGHEGREGPAKRD